MTGGVQYETGRSDRRDYRLRPGLGWLQRTLRFFLLLLLSPRLSLRPFCKEEDGLVGGVSPGLEINSKRRPLVVVNVANAQRLFQVVSVPLL